MCRSGMYMPSSESGSPEQTMYSTACPASSAARPIVRIKLLLPVPGPAFITRRKSPADEQKPS